MNVPKAIKELREIDQWVAYSRLKVPVSPRGFPAKSTDPSTWGTLAQAKFIRQVQGLPGVGFVLTKEDPYVGVDLDEAVDVTTGFLHPWAQEVVERLDSYTELSPSGMGVHIWVRGELPRRAYVVRDGRKIEVYSSARYFTVTGRPLPGCRQTIEARDMQTFVEDYCGASPDEPLGKRSDDWDDDDVERWLPQALACISPDDYHRWVKVGMAIKAGVGDEGWQWWDAWSAGSDKYGGPEETRRKWSSFGEGGEVGLGTVVYLAEQGGFSMPSPHPELPENFFEGWDEWLAAQEGVGDPEGMGDGLEIVIYDAAEMYLDDTPPEPDLIGPGVLCAGDFGLLFGPPKSMKSMICMDMFRAFAMGKPWCGFTVERPLRTLFAQFEVRGDRMRQRLQLADLTEEEVEAMRGNLLITERFTPHLDAEFVGEFAEAALKALEGKLDVLILDPLANIFSGESENDNAQMSEFIRRVKILRNAIDPNVAIVLVHHANKRAREEREAEPFGSIRGASALRGAYDAGLYVDKVPGRLGRVKVWSELRNGEGRPPFVLSFEEGRFVEVEGGEEGGEVDAEDFAEPVGIDEDFERVVVVLLEQAKRGRYYTASSFVDQFAGRAGMGSESGLKRLIRQMQARQYLRMFRRVEGLEVPELHHRSHGYLCVPGMVIEQGENTYPVRAEYAIDPRSGDVVELGS